MTVEATNRRRFLRLAAGGAIGVGVTGVAVRLSTSLHGGGPAGAGRLQLSADGGQDVAALEVPLGDDLLPQTSARRWTSSQLPTSVHSIVGFTWTATASAPHIRINSRVRGRWQGWRDAAHLHDRPDPGSGEGNGRDGTEPLWVGQADGIQVEVTGRRPADLTLVLLHPAGRTTDRSSRLAVQPPLGREVVTARPAILSRKDWGADESWRSGSPRYCSTIQQVHVHHTANSNDYTADDVPALLRGIYRYHTHNLGWSDIAYNFLVDKFGRSWVGRAGGVNKAVRGAHTLGFNATSCGVSVIGNYDLVAPDPSVVSAISAIAAWKLSTYDGVPEGWTSVVSEGSDKFGSGRTVSLPVIDGHRDTNDTACPGQYLYDQLTTIRSTAQGLVNAAQMQPIVVSTPWTIKGRPILGRTLEVVPGASNPPTAVATYTWLRNGAAIPGATGPSYRISVDDVGAQLAVHVDHSLAGYLSAGEDVAVQGLVMIKTATAAKVRGRRLRARVKVAVSALGGAVVPEGLVTIKVRDRTKKVALAGGVADVTFLGFRKGTYKVVVVYHGNPQTLESRAVETVHVH